MRRLRIYLTVFVGLLLSASPAASQDWAEVEPMPEARYGMSAVVVDGQIYVLGGRNRKDDALASVIRYDPATQTWHQDVRPMDHPRSEFAAVVLSGRIYVIGGRGERHEILDDVEVYDPSEDRWQDAEELEEKRHGHSAIVIDGRILVAGGVGEDNRLVETVEIFDPETERWQESDRLRMANPRVGFALVSVGDTVYVIGGFGGSVPVPLPHPERFDLDKGFELLPPEAVLGERGRLAAVSVGDSAYILGGEGVRGVLDDVVVFAPSRRDRSWTRGPRMRTARESFAAVSVEGRIYAIGGTDGKKALSTVEEMQLQTTVGVEDGEPFLSAHLEQNHPNPFTSTTTIPFVITGENSEHVVLEIYDVQGRLVTRLVDDFRGPGPHEVTWNGAGADGRLVSSGVYLYQLRQGSLRQTRILTRIR